MKGWIAGTLLATLVAVAIGTGTIAQEEPPDPTPEPATETTANVEVRVWQAVRDARSIYISARPEDGSWATLGTIPLPLDDGHSGSGRFRYGDITVAVPVASATKDVEVRVWQAVRDARSIYISARPEGGSWATLGTIPLPLDDGHSSSGRFRYGDITVEVPVPLPSAPTATPTPTPTPTPWVDPRPDDTYTLAELAAMPAPRAPEAPPLPDHVLALTQPFRYYTTYRGESYFSGWDGLMGVQLLGWDDLVAERVRIELSHVHNSRSYPVICNDPFYSTTWGTYALRCSYSADGPLNSAGTRRMSLQDASDDINPDNLELIEVLLDGASITCEERPSESGRSFYRKAWWCYDPATYRAWEAARERALAPPDDPLERYLRQQGEPPLWYDDSPYEGVGDYTTGVFRMAPYVEYEAQVEHDVSSPVRGIIVRCVSDSTGDSGYRVIGEVVGRAVWWWQTDTPPPWYARRASLCELEIRADGEWTVDFTPLEGQ